eukprot:1901003-Rhodomonas_salina.1
MAALTFSARSAQFTERLIIVPHTYLTNDHRQVPRPTSARYPGYLKKVDFGSDGVGDAVESTRSVCRGK